MKKISVVLMLILGISGLAFTAILDPVTDDIEKSLLSASTAISKAFARNFHFYTGVGNMSPIGAGKAFSMGGGVGAMLSGEMINVLRGGDVSTMYNFDSADPNADFINQVGSAVAMVPCPYDEVYVKLRMPDLFWPFKQWDAGVRIGYLPDVGQILANNSGGLPEGTSLYTRGFHLGFEGRTIIVGKPKSVFKVEGRVSWDWDFGGLGIALQTTMDLNATADNGDPLTVIPSDANIEAGFEMSWWGTSIGAKVLAGIDLPLLKLYTGVGVNLILGKFTTAMYARGNVEIMQTAEISIMDIDAPYGAMYTPVDISLLLGAQVLFINVAAEYSIIGGDAAVTIYPIVYPF